MKHHVPHDVSPQLARSAIEHAFASYQERFSKYSPVFHWANDHRANFSFTVRGKTLNGGAEIDERGITFELDVPLMFAIFKGTAIKHLEQEAGKWIAQAKAGG